jgi:CheY-like chemotaxis protein
MAKKILIIDDDPLLTKYLNNLFTDNGYETCNATNGLEGMEKIKDEKPDLITLDLQMPEEWGSKLYRKLSKDNELKKIPIIVISGLNGKYAIKDAVAFIRKPFDPDKLLGIVKSIIG